MDNAIKLPLELSTNLCGSFIWDICLWIRIVHGFPYASNLLEYGVEVCVCMHVSLLWQCTQLCHVACIWRITTVASRTFKY